MKRHDWARLRDWVNGMADELEPEHSPEAQKMLKEKRSLGIEEEKRAKIFHAVYILAAGVVTLSVVFTLLFTIFHLPMFGCADNPVVNEVMQRYVENGLEETGAVNMVAGMILDYRAFDTFGESSVLFMAVTCVMMLLLRDKNNISAEEDLQQDHERIIQRESLDVILKNVVQLVIPCILLFGVYVVLNGHISPGGGFSGGAIMGAALILYSTAYGVDAVSQFFTRKTFKAITSTALLCYGASKAYSFFTGANGLPTGIPLGTPGAIFSSGLILVLDICVGMVVACTMYGFYILFKKGEF